MKVQKLYREGLEHTLNTTISNGKGEVTALHVFSNMEEMHEKANETGRKFEEVLSSVMEQKQFPRHLYQVNNIFSIDVFLNVVFFQNTEADKPFDSYLWKKPSEMLTLQQLEDAFLVDHTETFKLRRSLLSEVCKLRNELEKEKLNYILKKQNFEQEIFYLKENYNQNMPVVAKMKRKCIILRDKRDRLVRELKTLDDLIKKESKMKEEAKFKDQNTLKLDASCARNAACSCYRKVLRDYQERASTLQSRILYEENLFYNYILEKPWRNAAFCGVNKTQEPVKTAEIAYWNQFLQFGLKDSDVDEILRLMEEFRLNLKAQVQHKQLKQSLLSESEELKCLLKFYYEFNKS
ncbi:hypothetical protein HNY73_008140 [Argiope bruennichi]|uniref:Uncharacterized protein n=2 Tax=Argiope bruennichi TaxID=94029 RepID=A0A8T0F6D1_ARGBR|nr:hypothetical protein HNY73_008140 [Argiope bruennichi]